MKVSTWSKISGQSNTRMISWTFLNTDQSTIINPEYSAWRWTQTHFIPTTRSLHLLRALSCTVLSCFKAKSHHEDLYNTLWKDHQPNFKISPSDLGEIQPEMEIVFKVTLNKCTNCWGGFALFYKTKLQLLYIICLLKLNIAWNINSQYVFELFPQGCLLST